MQIADLSMLSAVVLVVLAGLSQPRIGTDAAPSEGLTPFGFLMARAYGEPAEHQVMRFIAFKPSDGAKFRETFEKKHGPRGRDLIDSLGRGLYRTPTDQDPGAPVIADGASGKASVKNPVSGAERAKQQ